MHAVKGWSEPFNLNWSTSDAKAFELVDELTLPAENRLVEFDFMLGIACREKWTWRAVFCPKDAFRIKQHSAGEGPTRPEAICRAYLAAMEYLKGKKA
jgi:hypothetical protein